MSTKRKPSNPLGLSPAEFAAAEYNRIRLAQSLGGRNRWKGSTKNQRSASMRAVALSKSHAKPKSN